MTGHQRMREALHNAIYSRPRGIWERLTFPISRQAYEQGFKAGYATGFVDADRAKDET